MILDMRGYPFKPLRCEFKYDPSGKDDFAHNGRFDIAIIWALPSGLSKKNLIQELLQQYGCAELNVMSDMKVLRDLPEYNSDSLSRVSSVDIVRSLALRRKFPSVFALSIAARIYPDKFCMDKMADLLSPRFAEVKKMQPQGRSSVVTAFMQTKPPLIVHMPGKSYRWTSQFDNISASAELTELITANFGEEPPSNQDLDAVRD